MSLPTRPMHNIQEGTVVRTEAGVWRRVVAKRVAGKDAGPLHGYTTLVYEGGVEEEGPAEAPVTVFPPLTESQLDMLMMVGNSRVALDAGTPRLLWHPFPNHLSVVPIRKLIAFGLIEYVEVTPSFGAYRVTRDGQAFLDHLKTRNTP
jgi:hypothetical protein